MIIQAEALCFAYPNFALHNINFALHASELLAITGANGSGKTTLGKLLCGLLKPESGRVLLCGEDSTGWRLGQFGQRVGYLFQEPGQQIFAPTVLEELTFTQELRGVPQAQSHARAHELLARFELTHLAEQSTLTLSRGEQQRLALCGLLLNQPAALILDEPTTGLDPRRCDILAQALQECLRGGTAVLLISHDAAFVQANATRQLRMNSGVLHET
ncbi:MAG: energy-coupling factor ABC transporter ATP-binding protein [Oscillospiraceae bacterium]|nr:energy-coupling factor ABC transporter ATP-binding protein [Oscillospiraceae bacterium]